MKKRSTKILSLVLALVMVFSLFPMSALAAGGADTNGFGLGGGIKPRPMDQYPAQTLTSDEVDGLTVTVDAPKGALPLDVEMNVTKVEDLSAVQAAVDALDGVNGTALVAADITFVSNGKEIQPKKDVTVTMASDALPAGSELNVVHLDAAAEDLDDADVTAEPVAVTAAEANAVSFDADKFSIYVIVDGDTGLQTPRVTYHFLTELDEDGNANPYTFMNKHGEYVDYQIVKANNGTWEKLQNPGEPVVGLEKHFLGWFVVNKNGDTYSYTDTDIVFDENGEAVPPVTTDVTTGDKDVYVAPRYGQACIVTFWDKIPQDATALDPLHVVAKKVVYLTETEDGVSPASVVVNDISVPTKATESHTGWTSDNYKPGETTTKTLLEATSWDEVTGSCDLYATLAEGHWLRFAGGPAGSGAGYRSAIFVTSATTANELKSFGTVSREGYTFAGWYTVVENEDGIPVLDANGNWQYVDQITDANGNATDANAAALLQRILDASGDTTLYGKWTGNQVVYRVATWFQHANDDGYSFGEVTPSSGNGTLRGTAGTMTTVTASAVQHYTAKTIEQKEIKGDGTTIVNVYYDRVEYTLTFQAPPLASPSSGNGYYYLNNNGNDFELHRKYLYSYNGKWYTTRSGSAIWGYSYSGEYTAGVYTSNTRSTVYTITKRWGADISDEFPIKGTNGVTYNSGERWWPQANSVGFSTDEVMLKLMTMPQGNVTFYLNYPERPLKTMNYYVEALSTDTGTEAAPNNLYIGRNTVSHSSSLRFKKAFTISARYNGVTQIDLLTLEGFTLLGLSARADTDGYYIWDTEEDGTVNIYYTRNPYYIHFETQKSAAPAVANITGIPYEANIATTKATEIAALNQQYKINETTIEVPGEGTFVFQGWYDNAACLGSTFNFNQEMPAGNIELFAKWERVWYLIQIDPNGGEIPAPPVNEVTYTWLQYGDKIERYNIRRDYVEAEAGYTGVKYYYYNLMAWEDEHRHDESGYYYSDYRKGFYIREDLLESKDAFMAAFPGYNTDYADANWAMIQAHVDTEHAYRQATSSDSYSFVGWYKADINEDDTLTYTQTPYEFDPITGDTAIYAKWRRAGLYSVKYWTENHAATEGATVYGFIGSSLVQEDPSYADQAETQIAYKPDRIRGSDGKGYVFKGWKLAKPGTFDSTDPGSAEFVSDTLYQQGNDFTVDAQYADASQCLNLVAIYEPAESNPDTLPITTVTFNPNFPSDATDKVGETKKIEGVPLNTAIDLSKSSFSFTVLDVDGVATERTEEIPTYTAFGYVQIGWNHDQTAANAGTVEFKMTDTVGVDNADPDDNTLYAVWDKAYFYLFHSATGELEAIPMLDVDENHTYNVFARNKVAENCLYGGMYRTMVDVNADTDALKAAAKAKALDPTASRAILTPYAPYTGEQTSYWKRSNAFKATLQPEVDGVYYIKEVPNEFLKVYGRYTFEISSGEIQKIYLITTLDQSIYSSVNFTIQTVSGDKRATIAKTLTLSFGENSNQAPVSFTAKDLNGNLFDASLLGIYQATNDLAKDGTTYQITPNWVTLDGETVTGTARTLTVSATSITAP